MTEKQILNEYIKLFYEYELTTNPNRKIKLIYLMSELEDEVINSKLFKDLYLKVYEEKEDFVLRLKKEKEDFLAKDSANKLRPFIERIIEIQRLFPELFSEEVAEKEYDYMDYYTGITYDEKEVAGSHFYCDKKHYIIEDIMDDKITSYEVIPNSIRFLGNSQGKIREKRLK